MFKALQHLRWIVVLMVIVLCLVTTENIAGEKWQVVSELPTHREDFSAAVVGDKIYLIGGTLFENRQGPFGLSTVEVYDPKTNTWRRVADMPTSRAAPATAVVDNKIYVIGGHSGIDRRIVNIKTSVAVEAYNPQTDTWERKQDMPVPRRQFGVGVVAGKIYAIGGENLFEDPPRLDHVEVYDPVSDTWAKRADMPSRRDEVKVAVVRDTIYVIGGFGWPPFGLGAVLATIEAYQPKTNRWRKKSDMPNLKTDFSTVVVDDKIYLIGGYGVAIKKHLKTVEVYDPETERWDESPPMPTKSSPFGAETVNGKIYILGSEIENGERSLDVEVFDTGFRAVTAAGKLSVRWGKLKAEHAPQP
jgi:N-acetylneuraminic acid mutarotase